MIVKLLTKHHLEFLSLKGGCRGSSESTLVKLVIIIIISTASVKQIRLCCKFSLLIIILID